MACCVTLSNLADCYIEWKKYDLAKITADRLLAAAQAIKSNEQLRIAKEILYDIAKATGNSDPNAGIRQNKSYEPSVIPTLPNGIILEPPTKRCFNPAVQGCPNVGRSDVVLKRCGGCQRVWYCSSECQKAHWPDHKHVCRK